MKRLFSILAATLIAGMAHAATFSVDFFHDRLEAHGDWREVGDYGYCWQPRDVGDDWRPYSDGRWLYTDAGWTWDSDEPYSWAVYHYGRWARVDRVGWVWVPGTEWGPAWVSWRRSERHVGWAPLPPEATFTRSVGFSARVDVDFDIGPMNFSFVNVRDFGSRRLSRVIIAPTQNVTIINRTTNITNISYVNNTVINNGPQYDVIARESAQPIRRMKLDRHEEFEGNLRAVEKGDSLRVAAPTFDAKPASAPRKVVAKVENAEINRGWKRAGTDAEVAKLRSKIKDEPVRPVQQSPDAETPKKAPKNADVPPKEKPEKSVAETPATEKPATEKPAAEKPATEKPATEKPATEKPATEKPATEKPAAEKPAAEKPNPTKKPTAKEQAPKREQPKADPPQKPKAKPAVIAKPATADEARAAAEKEKPPVPKAEPRKSKPPEAPVREETKQSKKVQPGNDAPARKLAPEAPKLPDPKPVAKKPVTPESTATAPAKGKGKKKDKDDEVPAEEKP